MEPLKIKCVELENGKLKGACNVPRLELIDGVEINGEHIKFDKLGLTEITLTVRPDDFPKLVLKYNVMPVND